MTIDAHQHVWSLARGDYSFPPADDALLYRDYAPEDLRPDLEANGVAQTILVQATETVAETGFLLETAHRTAFVAGVVGWWDGRSPAGIEALRRLPHAGRLVGVRPMLQGMADVSWLLEPGPIAAMHALRDAGLAFDALVETRHLPAIAALARAVPGLRMVIDHMAKPWRQPDQLEAWRRAMQELAAIETCWVKVSGYPFGAAPPGSHWTYAALAAALRGWFGADRLVWGSDWPVVLHGCSYAAALEAARRQFADAPGVFAANARLLYQLRG